jgi:hypothetical protein
LVDLKVLNAETDLNELEADIVNERRETDKKFNLI